MRTRRSPRNQEILFRALFPKSEPPTPAPPKTAEEIREMWWLPKTSRNALLRDLSKRKPR